MVWLLLIDLLLPCHTVLEITEKMKHLKGLASVGVFWIPDINSMLLDNPVCIVCMKCQLTIPAKGGNTNLFPHLRPITVQILPRPREQE